MSAFAGVNLRVEDLNNFNDTCSKAGISPSTLPVLAIIHDDDPHMMAESLYLFSGYNVVVWRCMSPNSQLPLRAPADGGLPHGAHIIGWNEHDGTDPDSPMPGWIDPWWQEVRAKRPDLVIHYGAPNVDNQWPENQPLEASLDIVDRHIGATFQPPSNTIQGRPVWVTEIDVDPNHPESMDEVVACAQRSVSAGIPAFIWGMDNDIPDAVYNPDILKGLVQINKEQNNMALDPEVESAMVEMEARQNAALTEMWKRFRQGKFSGADGIDGKIVELQGGTPLDFTPTYP